MNIDQLSAHLADLETGLHTLQHRQQETAAAVHRQEGAIWAVRNMIAMMQQQPEPVESAAEEEEIG